MNQAAVQEKKLSKVDFSKQGRVTDNFEDCTFEHCSFSKTNLSNIIFSECTFIGCDFSIAALAKTVLRGACFKECKLLGLHFEQCNNFIFTVDFENCILDLSCFYKLSLKKTRFRKCSLHEVDFTECDLTGALFEHCDLSGAKFDRTVLAKADLRTSFNYAIDPERNRLTKAKFSAAGIAGLLGKYNIEID